MSTSLHRASHLGRRFATSLWPGPPRSDDDAWVRSVLRPEEYELWSQLPNQDRRHSIGVARRVQAALAATELADDDRWPTAALLHDVGKVDARLGVLGRVVATIAGTTVRRGTAAAWAERRGVMRRVGLYLQHGALGAERIRQVGGTREAARWAAAHHDPSTWSSTGIPGPVVTALHEADDD